MNHIRSKVLSYRERSQGLEWLHGEGDPKHQPRGYNKEAGNQKDRTDIEAVDHDKGSGQRNQNSKIGQRSRNVSGDGASHGSKLDEAPVPDRYLAQHGPVEGGFVHMGQPPDRVGSPIWVAKKCSQSGWADEDDGG